MFLGFSFSRLFFFTILPPMLCSNPGQSYRALVEWLIPNVGIRYRSGTKRQERGAKTTQERVQKERSSLLSQQHSFFPLAQDTPAPSQLSGGERASCMASHGKIIIQVPASGGQLFILK